MVSCKWFPTAYFIWQIALLTLHGACRFTYGDTMALSVYSAARECATECVCVSVCVCVCVCTKSLQSCLTLCDPVDHNPPGSSVHGILQTRILEWVAIFSPEDLPDPGIKLTYPALEADSLPSEPPGFTTIYLT